MKIFSLIRRTLLLENSPIPRFHIYTLFIFAITALIVAPFIPVSDPELDYEINTDALYNNSMIIDVPANEDDQINIESDDFQNSIVYSDYDNDSEGIFKDTFDLEELNDTKSDYEWLTYTVKENETLTTIFRTLNLPLGTLQKIMKVDVKNSLVQLRINEQIDFLIDEKGILRCLSLPLKNGTQEILFVRNKEKEYVSYIDPLNFHKNEETSVIINPRDTYIPKVINNEIDDKKQTDETNRQQNTIIVLENNPINKQIAETSISDIFSNTEKDLKKDEQEQKLIAEKKKREEQLLAENKISQTNKTSVIKTDPSVISGKIVQGSFAIDGQNAGLSKKQMKKITDVFKGKIDFRRDLKKGDSFKVLFDRNSKDEKAKILAINFSIKGKNMNLFLSDSDGRYYDEYGVNTAITTKFLKIPVATGPRVRLTSPFSPKRYHPTLKRYRAHLGTDYGCPYGSPIFTTADGTVVRVGHQFPGAGHYIVIDHGNRIQTVYMHLSKILVHEGQKLKQKQTIGLAGMSGGISTGPHIHYQLEINGHAVDSTNPGLPIYNPVKSSGSSNKVFLAKVRQYKKQLNIR